jgi:hypothetical protein
MNRYMMRIFWKDRAPTRCSALGINKSQAIMTAVSVSSRHKNEMYDHNKTEKTVRMVD